ncbi:hypothetical protein Pint_10491 [Pistacia integerrima]|uniref:Uncharacterized protein n=1 Tax=Pistacia integerrima TaxID=434235 RepID=A0ACC0XFQ8_9ROSI|nr:hypothetical protein Pint_10491 [Pistacia integerrima]
MAVTHSLSSFSPSLSFIVPKLLFFKPGNRFPVVSCTSPKTTASLSTEQEVLKAVVESDGNTLPCVRTYENDLARLSLVGAVGFNQALTAAAADGGQAASEHVMSGLPAMVVETVYPGPTNERATVSTRLFLPARKVEEKAKRLRKSLSKDVLYGTTSKNILAMTFRQVVMQQLLKFELVLFRPGAERDMEDLENPRKVPASFTLSSSDEWVISILAEVVCISALQSTERHFLNNSLDEIIENAKSLLETFNSTKENVNPVKVRPKHNWWSSSAYSKLEKIGGPDFCAWTSEYVPAYKLQIDASRFKDVKFDGWRNCAENRWEILLTHSQMVGLADVLDMYYEDIFTLPSKQLSCEAVVNYTNLSSKKVRGLWFVKDPGANNLLLGNYSFLKILSVTLASGIFLVAISALGQFFLPHLYKGDKYPRQNRLLPSSQTEPATHQLADAAKLEEFCVSIVKRIKDAFDWRGDIMTEKSIGAWIGGKPNYLKLTHEDDSSNGENSTDSAPSEKMDADMKSSVQDIASYQVVLSTDGKIIGFQPTSRVGVNHWAANPLARELYGGKKLAPGFIEPNLKIRLPNEIVLIELLMSVNSDSCFALARPIQIPVDGPVVPEPPSITLEEQWETLLAGFKAKSLVFCAFGSECIMQKAQFQELVLGFELTGSPFFAALKPPMGHDTIESALPQDFQGVRGRRYIHGG